VRIIDDFGNPVPDALSIEILLDSSSFDRISLNGVTSVVADGALALFDQLQLWLHPVPPRVGAVPTTGAEKYRLHAVSATIARGASAMITVEPAVASRLVFSTQPLCPALVGSIISTPVTVFVEDEWQNRVQSAGFGIDLQVVPMIRAQNASSAALIALSHTALHCISQPCIIDQLNFRTAGMYHLQVTASNTPWVQADSALIQVFAAAAAVLRLVTAGSVKVIADQVLDEIRFVTEDVFGNLALDSPTLHFLQQFLLKMESVFEAC
jgi:hypothetical protein